MKRGCKVHLTDDQIGDSVSNIFIRLVKLIKPLSDQFFSKMTTFNVKEAFMVQFFPGNFEMIRNITWINF